MVGDTDGYHTVKAFGPSEVLLYGKSSRTSVKAHLTITATSALSQPQFLLRDYYYSFLLTVLSSLSLSKSILSNSQRD